MTDENKPREVYLQRDGKTWRWGQSSYFRRWSGFKQTFSFDAFKGLALPVAIVFGILTYVFSGQKDFEDNQGIGMAAPEVSSNLPIIAPKILEDLPNTIRRQPVDKGVAGQIKVYNLRSVLEIPVGSEARAILESGATSGIVKARLENPIIVDDEPLLPEGTVVFGHGKSTEERLYVEFEKAIFPTGEAFLIRAQAFDISDKILGLKGSLVGSRTKKIALGMGLGFLGGMASGLENTSGAHFWGTPEPPSIKDAALAGTSKAALDQSQIYLDQMKNSPEIIEVKNGTHFYLIIDEPKSKEKLNE